MNEFTQQHKTVFVRLGIAVLVLLGLFLLVATVAKLKEYRYIGSGTPSGNTISVTGQGNVERAPDTARISFTVRNEAKDVASAQKVVSDKIDTITAHLKDAGIDKDDVTTERYSSNPQYTYSNNTAPVLRGYEVSQMVTVKISDLALVESVAGILGRDGVTDMQGPNFGFDDDKKVAREAREAAIKDAKEQAKKLAADLGVDLVRIVSFNESGANSVPSPMYARNEMMMAQDAKAGNPIIPVGNTDIVSTVTIVYEIR